MATEIGRIKFMDGKAKKWKFDDISVGYKTERVGFYIRPEEIDDFVRLSGDASPLHINDEFAKAKGFDGRIVHGIMLASKISYIIGMVIPGEGGIYMAQELVFHKPIYVNEQCAVQGTVIRKSEATRIVEIKTEIFNSKGELAVDGTAKVKML